MYSDGENEVHYLDDIGGGVLDDRAGAVGMDATSV